MKFTPFILIGALWLVGCQSAQQYNEFNQKKIATVKLQADVAYLQKKFLDLHPDADLYLPLDSLNSLFEQVKTNLTEPLTPKEFYHQIAPVIAAVRQGHSRVVYPSNRLTKAEAKRYKDTRGPLSQFSYEWINDSLYLASNQKKMDSTPVGSAVVAINGVSPQDFYEEFIRNYTSDGFNTTYLERGFSKRFAGLFTNRFGSLDSITYVLRCQDSLFTVTNTRYKMDKTLDKTQPVKVKDSVSTHVQKKWLKEKKHLARREKRRNKILGTMNGAYNRELLFPIADDSTFAVLKIRSFSSGKYQKAYDSLFATIKEKNIQHLVLDLRDNPGGLVADINTLYRYLKFDDEALLREAKVTSKSKLPFRIIKGWPKWRYFAFAPFFPPYYTWVYLNTKKDNTDAYQFQLSGLQAKKRSKNVYSGKLAVLVNGGSFSASCIITSNLQGSKRALVYGEETGGTFNGTVAGIMPLVTLPASKLKVRIGLMHIKPKYESEVIGRGIFPDIPISQTTDEQLFEINSEYYKIYENSLAK